MGLTLHDGSHDLYKGYSNGKAWNDEAFLMLNSSRSVYDEWLMRRYNTDEGMTALFTKQGITTCKLFGDDSSTVGEYVGSTQSSIIVVKGLHQWQRRQDSPNYGLHVTIGLEGWLWHLKATYYHNADEAKAKVSLLPRDATKGQQMTGVDHEGFQRI